MVWGKNNQGTTSWKTTYDMVACIDTWGYNIGVIDVICFIHQHSSTLANRKIWSAVRQNSFEIETFKSKFFKDCSLLKDTIYVCFEFSDQPRKMKDYMTHDSVKMYLLQVLFYHVYLYIEITSNFYQCDNTETNICITMCTYISYE